MISMFIYQLSLPLNRVLLPQAAQAQYESTCGYVIFKMVVIIKDLYGNSGQ